MIRTAAANTMSSPFTRKTLSFLRSLKRNNDREWFRARKADYERHVRGPMIELIERLAVDFPALRARNWSSIRRCRSTASTATPASAPTSRRSRRTSPPTSRRAGCRAARAPGCTSRSRRPGSGSAAASTCRRPLTCGRSASTSPPATRDCTGWCTQRRSRQRSASLRGDRLTRVPRGYRQRSPGRALPAIQAVPGRPRIPRRVRHRASVLSRVAGHLPRCRPARPLPQRAVSRPACCHLRVTTRQPPPPGRGSCRRRSASAPGCSARAG